MKTTVRTLLFFSLIALVLSGCSGTYRTMREPNNYVEFQKGDFLYSDQVSASAKTVKVFGIDWKRLFKSEGGEILGGSVGRTPVIGNTIGDRTSNYALYKLMKDNEGYDIVVYPQYSKVVKRPIGIPLVVITEAKVSGRLGLLKKD